MKNETVRTAARTASDASTAAWALTAVTCLVLLLGVVIIRQVSDRPHPVHQKSAPTEPSNAQQAEPQPSPLLVLRPVDPSKPRQANPSGKPANPAEKFLR